jgi:cation-transporting ATPase F
MKPQTTNWHNQPLETLTSALQIDVQQGLSDIQAEQLMKRNNMVPD